jgi:hypothetical protein
MAWKSGLLPLSTCARRVVLRNIRRGYYGYGYCYRPYYQRNRYHYRPCYYYRYRYYYRTLPVSGPSPMFRLAPSRLKPVTVAPKLAHPRQGGAAQMSANVARREPLEIRGLSWGSKDAGRCAPPEISAG